MKKIAICASGAGSNAEAIMKYFKNRNDIRCELLICDRKNAGVYDRCQAYGVETHYFPKSEWAENKAENVMQLLSDHQIDLIVLAGFFAIIPQEMVAAYNHRIINIHPSLLPKYGGKGMWGMHVHQAVIDNRELESGITIHYVSDRLDAGAIILQEHCNVYPDDTPDSLASRIHFLEHKYYPAVIETLLS